MPSTIGYEESFSDQDENGRTYDIKVDVKVINQRKLTIASNGLITKLVE